MLDCLTHPSPAFPEGGSFCWHCWHSLQDHFFLEATTEEIEYIEGNGGVVGVARGSPECFRRLMDLYDRGHVPPMATPGPDGPRVVQMGFRDGHGEKDKF